MNVLSEWHVEDCGYDIRRQCCRPPTMSTVPQNFSEEAFAVTASVNESLMGHFGARVPACMGELQTECPGDITFKLLRQIVALFRDATIMYQCIHSPH
ncbi:hypothetical protein CEXT_694411 [Caerostris extrusa]|uniref:Uncharacterized protein n=1 Tax=Caerostris extrusa TaxID=172846 RepID=A0AAV4XZK8_CAEEX|nr:hypothetical protein CEXT_694411 [Caerostris extrusa]